MGLASRLADAPFSDRPETASPVITAFLRTYNDGLDDDLRQDLYPLAALIVGTRASPRWGTSSSPTPAPTSRA
jgi:hypothetical protein